MRIKLLTARSGVDGSFGAGEILDIDETEAVAYMVKGLAEPVNATGRAALAAALEEDAEDPESSEDEPVLEADPDDATAADESDGDAGVHGPDEGLGVVHRHDEAGDPYPTGDPDPVDSAEGEDPESSEDDPVTEADPASPEA